VSRVDVRLDDKSEWVKIFDQRDFALFVRTDDPPQVGSPLRIDLIVGKEGPRIILRGTVASRRTKSDGELSAGCTVVLGPHEREKINYLNGFVRGGLLNLRERRRLPVRLPVTYGALDGPRKTFTRDINEQGVFVISEDPLPEETKVHLLITWPKLDEPLSLTGEVSHTVLIEDEDLPGMGIVFVQDEVAAKLEVLVDKLEQEFLSGRLPEEFLL
jgi:hypothetical protein